MLTYNQNGTSRGIASIQFNRADTAAKATKELNGLLVDGRPMKVDFFALVTFTATLTDLYNRSKLSMMLLMFPLSLPPSLLLSALRKLMSILASRIHMLIHSQSKGSA